MLKLVIKVGYINCFLFLLLVIGCCDNNIALQQTELSSMESAIKLVNDKFHNQAEYSVCDKFLFFGDPCYKENMDLIFNTYQIEKLNKHYAKQINSNLTSLGINNESLNYYSVSPIYKNYIALQYYNIGAYGNCYEQKGHFCNYLVNIKNKEIICHTCITLN